MSFPFLDAWRRWRNRSRYDLSKLREVDTLLKTKAQNKAEPEADAPLAAAHNHIYCHHCGSSMSQAYSICPECGIPLGS